MKPLLSPGTVPTALHAGGSTWERQEDPGEGVQDMSVQ